MLRYLARRILQIFPVVLLAVMMNFLLINLAPGDPAVVMAGEHAPVEYIAELRKSYGLDAPVLERLGTYLVKLMHGDLGYSFAYRRPVLELLLERAQATMLLVLISQFFSILLGTWLGAYAARHHNRIADKLISYGTILLYCMPIFWIGMMLIMIFAVKLQWLPSSGMTSFMSFGRPRWIDIAIHMILPATCLFLHTLPIYAKLARASVLEVAREDFITTARAIGFSERVVYMRHALRNALLPTVTVAGLSLSALLTGALLVETVFAWPGLGRLMFEAVSARDYPVLMGGFLFATLLVIIGNFIVDVIYTYLDPRVIYS
ncbi:ABC transporter permease [Microvirga alba]|uniref:ABC transporter permease n=1 Tax=Microvirga alba TaxID=2791025 RepID=A0A931FNM3_9HYPH|nr:ABC transporter permease [Microvirga alba]MBF9233825.1 ABC transporter permease [Microvirga alba]